MVRNSGYPPKCSIFRAAVAESNDRSGHARLSHQAITDVTATNYGTNVTGVVADTSGAKKETARALATPTPQVTTFTSALYNSPSTTRWFVLSFGTDSSLNATPGWDNVTGLGTPNGYRFVMEAAGK